MTWYPNLITIIDWRLQLYDIVRVYHNIIIIIMWFDIVSHYIYAVEWWMKVHISGS